MRTQLETLASNAKWMELLEEAESALIQHRFQPRPAPLHARALASLGLGHDAARKALVAEVAAWLRRMPGGHRALGHDGTPVADAQTRAWLDLEVAGEANGPRRRQPGSRMTTAEAVREAKSLFANGKVGGGTGAFTGPGADRGQRPARFRLRLELAKLCVAASQPAVARALYAALAKECTVHDLDTWEPRADRRMSGGPVVFPPSGALSEEDRATTSGCAASRRRLQCGSRRD